MFRTIGPVWDGNEVWLVMAGGATFAAFPAWYATMFSGFYLALLLVLFFLIVRVLSFEWRTKARSARWRTVWTWANTIGSFGASLVWGVGLSALLYGVPIDSSGDFSGDFADIFNLYTVLGGVTIVLLFAYHGATYLTIRTTGALCERAAGAARRLSLVATVVGAGFLAGPSKSQSTATTAASPRRSPSRHSASRHSCSRRCSRCDAVAASRSHSPQQRQCSGSRRYSRASTRA